MVTIKAIIKKYGRKGEKTGWTYVDIAQKQAQKIKADYKRSYKVKGHIDSLEVTQLTMVPMGEGNFIIPLKSEIRKMIKKELGDTVVLKLVEWHFDIAGLIEKGEAIDVNTLQINPYK